MKRKKRARIIAAVCTTLFLLTVTAVFLLCFRVEQKINNVTYELGDTVSVAPSSYITGQKWSVDLAKVDASELDESRVGEYTIFIKHAWQEFECRVTIEDTTPPELEVTKDTLYLATGEVYKAEKFVESVSDKGQISRLTVDDKADISFSSIGDYEIIVGAEDNSGNTSIKRVWVTVDTPPSITGIKPIYISLNEPFDPAVGVSALDEVDGDVTEDLLVDMSKANLSEPGEYEVIYEATDSYGLEGRASGKITVCSPLELQEKINQHLINEDNDHIYGAINIHDAGYYDEDDIDFVLSVMEPCVVYLRFPFPGGYSEGSGFVMDMDDESVTICTNAHVAKGASGPEDTCTFYDGTRAHVYRFGDMNEESDVAFMKVNRSDIDDYLWKELKTVHINNGYWTNLSQNPDISIGFRTIRMDGSVKADKTGVLLQKEGYCDIEKARNWVMSEVTCENFPGSSGSAVFDSHGNLVAMVRAQSIIGGKTQYWCVTFRQITEWYQNVMGKSAYYY
ncbi:Trypsin-like peptidase domain-containing protein [Lachnospiraceae bacterium G11]|nr:Trypsin-like peptidase domain-containing protein [Lachnospiraceae bacterium G11]